MAQESPTLEAVEFDTLLVCSIEADTSHGDIAKLPSADRTRLTAGPA
jgi:hypothetical protein